MTEQERIRGIPSGEVFHSTYPSPLGRISWGGRHLGILAGKAMGFRRWDTYSLVYVLEGTGTFEDENGLQTPLSPGDLMLHFPLHGYRYKIMDGAPWSEFFLQFQGPLFTLWEEEGLLSRQKPVLHLEPVEVWWNRLEALLAPLDLPEPAQSLRRCLQLQEFLADALAAEQSEKKPGNRQPGNDWYSQACTLIEDSLGTAPDWERISRRLGSSYAHFRRRFKEEGGITPGHFRSVRQVEWAQRLLQKREKPIKEIAEECGFCSPYHFASRFRTFTGMSPTQFRKRAHLI